MSENLEHSFVTQLKENQNIIHKICRLYTDCEDSHKDLFQGDDSIMESISKI
jgi:RNA polymerase sigma-70 factor (ECF subfamily)